jgi:DNA-binding protein HU-beta
MNKTELVAAVAEKTGASKKDSEKLVSAVFETITNALVAGDKVSMVGFGAFEIKERPARIGRNPRTKAEIEIPASRAASFKPGKALKDAINK